MNKNQHVWQERYRPDTIKDLILPKSLRTFFNKIIEGKKIPHMTLFSSFPGTGKTSCAKAVCKDLNIDNYLYINASKDGRMDTLENEISDYVSALSMDDEQKVVILDDAECASDTFQKSLRVFIEQYSENCSFIITTNNLNKIDEKLLSRCPPQDFNISEMSVKKEIAPLILVRLEYILKNENVKYDVETLKNLIRKYFPDMRQMIAILQRDFLTHGSITENILKKMNDYDTFFQLLKSKNVLEARKYLIDNGVNYDEMYSILDKQFIKSIPDKDKQNEAILIIAKYSYYSSLSLDKEIPFAALIVEIMRLL